MRLSVAMITFNGEKIIDKTLRAVHGWADEIVAVDSHSSDSTPEIVAKYNGKVFDEDWKGEGLQYKSAVEKCSGDWILILDQDEVLTDELKAEIDRELANPKFSVYELILKNVIFGKLFKYGGTTTKRILFRQGEAHFAEVAWHSQMSTDKPVGKLHEIIHHHTYRDLDEYFSKFNRYTTDIAAEMFKKGKKAPITKIVFSPILTFVKEYFLRLYCLNGSTGLLFALLGALYTATKYLKLAGMHRLD